MANAQLVNMMLRAQYYRLQAKADKTKGKFEVDLSPEVIEEVHNRIRAGERTGKIAANMSLTKEYVDALKVKYMAKPVPLESDTSTTTSIQE